MCLSACLSVCVSVCQSVCLASQSVSLSVSQVINWYTSGSSCKTEQCAAEQRSLQHVVSCALCGASLMDHISVSPSFSFLLQALEGELASQNERLSIVTRFVEWFTSRGESYEHNIKIIDKHLGDLTNNAVNRMDKLPYQGHIKFSSVLGDNAREGSSY